MGVAGRTLCALMMASCTAWAQQITTVAGNGMQSYSGDGGPAVQAGINTAVYVAADLYGNIFIADQNNNRIRKVNPSGIVTTIAGNGSLGFSGDGGPASQAVINYPTGVCTDAAGDLYFNDLGNFRVRKIDTSGIITTVAGNGVRGSTGDGGPATQASMFIPIRCAVDSVNNLYIADQGGQKIRKVTPAGIISTVAGTGNGQGVGTQGSFSGDGGLATSADLNNPTAVAVDSAGNVYFSDQFNQRIRKVDTHGIITTIAGTGAAGYNGDGGQATSFGSGIHKCLGMHLARMEMGVLLNAVLDRLPGLRLDPDAADVHIHGLIFRSPPNLPVRFDPA